MKNKGKKVAKIISKTMKKADREENLTFTNSMIDVFVHDEKITQWDEVTLLIRILDAMAGVETDESNRIPVKLAGIAKQAIEKELGFPIKEII